jgi:predicted glycosyltransferase
MPRVLFYVQHLLGLGHDARAAAMTRAMIRAGLDVTYINGGFSDMPLDLLGAGYVPLPPLKATSPAYDGLLGAADTAPDDAYWTLRQERLQDAFDQARPDVLLIETFPFGRWPFRRELLPLLDLAKGRCRILCSVRDILEPKAEGRRNRQIVALVNQYFDLVLVHGDPVFVPLDETFPFAAEIGQKVRYTGYVASEIATGEGEADEGRGEVIVSAGGGATCEALMQAAAEAASQDGRPWRFLLGPNCPAAVRNFLAATADMTVEPVRPDFARLLGRAAASVSQAGYNTTLDILSSNTPAVMVPHEGHGQTEQFRRAARLAKLRRVALVREEKLTGASLLRAIAQAQALKVAASHAIDCDGARCTAELIRGLCAAGEHRQPAI